MIYSYLKEGLFAAVEKQKNNFKLSMWKRYHLSIEIIKKGYLFCQEWYIKGCGEDRGAEPTRIKLCWSPPPHGIISCIVAIAILFLFFLLHAHININRNESKGIKFTCYSPCFHLFYPLCVQTPLQEGRKELRKQWSPVPKCFHSQKCSETQWKLYQSLLGWALE